MNQVSTQSTPSTNEKALTINLNPFIYGTFAEIGAGQEVARQFFAAGGAAGTVAKTMSAYDMKVSDDIYGKAPRYVSRDRLVQMLEHEYHLLVERLDAGRGESTTFFSFADTVVARGFKASNQCHGWLGVRFQISPREKPNDIMLHVTLKDNQNLLQQQALGVLGVNLLYGCFYHRDDPEQFVRSLLDNLTIDRMEIDMLEFHGPRFADVDNRVVSLRLIQHGLTPAVMFGPGRTVLQPSEALYKKPVLMRRGSFRPMMKVHLDMMEAGVRLFRQEPSVKDKEIVMLAEITMRNLSSRGHLDPEDFVLRADTISALGIKVLITDFPEFYHLPGYFRRYTSETIGVSIGADTLAQLFDERFYSTLPGGILEAFGRLFHNNMHLYVYPLSRELFERFVPAPLRTSDPLPDIVGSDDVRVPTKLKHLLLHLKENGYIRRIDDYNHACLLDASADVEQLLLAGDKRWENLVPPQVAQLIKERKLFGLS